MLTQPGRSSGFRLRLIASGKSVKQCQNLIQINVAPASNCFAVIATVLGETRAVAPKVLLRPLGWAAFFLTALAILVGVRAGVRRLFPARLPV